MFTCKIRVHYPTQFGDTIYIRGNTGSLSWDKGVAAEWTTSQSDKESGFWSLSLSFQSDQTQRVVEFKPVLNDKVWAKGSNYLVNIDGEVDVYPFFYNTSGSIYRMPEFYSHILNVSRRINIYLPPSYYENTSKRYPVIFMNDGHNLFEAHESLSGHAWRVQETIDDLANNDGIKEVIVVGVVPVNRTYEYLYNLHHDGSFGGGANKYLDFLIYELKPFVYNTFRTTQPLSQVGIIGSSYGGVISLFAWLTRPDEFDVCGALSPSCGWDNRSLFQILKDNAQRPGYSKLYIDSGYPRDSHASTRDFAHEVIQKNHLCWMDSKNFEWEIKEGHGHSEQYWSIRLPRVIKFLYPDYQRVVY
eukprot:TRINITY_DN2486_c0_g1_i1.p1 TRINITY_DN2486_c0_g1~~TRINITY_DN2486_c0_g1_i1.p1  ORF type:complete len:359 (+),score=69.83 TRINITY_DN2486_c0_g1_i1:207-1283(+)